MPVPIELARPPVSERIAELARKLGPDEGMFTAEVAAKVGCSYEAAQKTLCRLGPASTLRAHNPETGHKARMLVHPDTARRLSHAG